MLWPYGTLKSSLEERVNLLGNQEKKRSHSDKGIRREERVIGSVLDAVIQIISLAIVQNHLATKIKRPSLEVTLNSSYYSDNASSLDNGNMQIEYDSLCEISLKIINKNKILKTKRDLLEKEILELNEKIKKLEKSKEIDIACKSCEELKLENAKLKETQVKFVKFDKSAKSLREMLNNQNPPSCKIGLRFNDSKASTSGTKIMNFVGSTAEKATDESTIKVHRSTLPGSVCLRTCLELDEWIKDSDCSKHMTGNKSLFSTYKAYDGGSSIIAIRTDHGWEFDNEVQFGAYCDAQGITHNFSAPRTLQSNGVVERKNRTLQEMSRTMLNEQSIP
ncbi:zf-CCHC domain-containing protein [Tanacetum coccineum]